MTILEKIMERLNVLGMSVCQLSERVNISSNLMNQYIRGEASPTEAELRAIGNALWPSPQDIPELCQCFKAESPKSWLVIEVCERELGKILQLPTEEAAFEQANELLKKHAKNIGYEDEFAELEKELAADPDADEGSCEVQVAHKGRTGAWCNWHDEHWDAFVIQMEDIMSHDTVMRTVYRLLDENQHNLEEEDVYAQGYHDALLDILDSLGLPRNPKYGSHFD